MSNPIISDITNTIANIGDTITLSPKIKTENNYRYKWSVSISGISDTEPVTFQTINNATGLSLALTNIDTSQHLSWYKLNLTDTTTGEEFFTKPAQIGVYPTTLNVTGLVLYAYSNNYTTELAVYPSSNYTYIWQKLTVTNNEELNLTKYVSVTGGSSNKLSLTNLDLGDHCSQYRVIVSGESSDPWTSPPITVFFDPSINIVQDNIENFTLTNSKRLYVIAETANGNIEYSWQKSIDNGPFVDIPGAEQSYIDLSGLSSTDVGNKYRVELTSDVSKVYTKYSRAAEILQLPPNPEYGPVIILNQPPEYVYMTTTGVSLNCNATYDQTFGSMWFKSNDLENWNMIPANDGYQGYGGPLNSILNISPSSFEDKKEYYKCRFFNEDEEANQVSNISIVDYNTTTYVTQHPSGTTAVGGSASFTCKFFQNQTGIYDYAWYRFPISGTNVMKKVSTQPTITRDSPSSPNYTSTLSLVGLSVNTNDGDRYAFVAKNKSTQNVAFISKQANVIVPNTLTIISGLPDFISIEPGSSASLSVSVTSSAGSVSYEWYKSTNSGLTFSSIPGATSNSLTLSPSLEDNQTYYRVIVSDPINQLILK